MMRKRVLIASATLSACLLAAAGLAVAKADSLLDLGKAPQKATIYRDNDTPAQDRQIAKAAFTQSLEHRTDFLGMIPAENLPSYAPIYPGSLILSEEESPSIASGGVYQYDAAAPLGATVDFYEDAAARAHLPFTVTHVGPDAVLFHAGDGKRTVDVRLTRQFANSTVVDGGYS